MQALMQWFKGLQIKRTMYIDRFEIMKHTFSQKFTINYCPNKASLPLYSLALLLISTTSYLGGAEHFGEIVGFLGRQKGDQS